MDTKCKTCKGNGYIRVNDKFNICPKCKGELINNGNN